MSSFRLCDSEPRVPHWLLLHVLWVWLSVGSTLVLLGPLQGRTEWLGWLPFWAVVWPATSLLMARCCRHQTVELSPRRNNSSIRGGSRTAPHGAHFQYRHRGLQSCILNQQLNAIVMRSSSPK